MRLVAQACSAAAALAPPFVASPAAPAPPPTSLLGEYPRLPQWLAAFTLKVPARAARRAVAAALFQICEEEVSSAPSLRTPRRAPEVLPLLLRAMRPRLQQAAEVLAGGGGDSQSGMDGGGGEGSAVGAVAAAGAGAPVSISSSHEFLALLAALLQLALHPGRSVMSCLGISPPAKPKLFN